MKKTLAVLLAACAATAFAAIDKTLDIRPEEKPAKAQTSVEWENGNAARLEEATRGEVLAAFVAGDAAAAELLSKVRGAYETDSLVARQVAAVSQWVMEEDPSWFCFWRPSRTAGRKVWVRALVAAAEKSSDPYVKTFCLDQLRWCGYAGSQELCARIAQIGDASGDKAVLDFSRMVARELKGEAVGF